MSFSNKKITFIDLFCGAGGFSKGLEMAGLKCVAALDNNKACIETHKYNFPASAVIQSSITDLSPEEFYKKTNVKKTDLIVGGPPCPTFSTIGGPKINSLNNKNIFKDKRNFLFQDFFKYIAFYKPEAFLMENVPNFMTKYNGEIYNQTLKFISDLGYVISNKEVKVLNAVNYGVPQNRKRMFLFGHKKKYKFSYPEITHFEQKQNLFENNYKKYITVKSAISDLPKITDNWRIGKCEYSKSNDIDEYQRLMRKNNINNTVSNNICRSTNDRAKKVFIHMKQGSKYMDLPKNIRNILPFREDIFHDRLKRLDNSKPSWTVIAHIGMDGYMYIHPEENRTLSVREAARLQSFPDDFVFVGTQNNTYHMVGNAVPPLISEALGKSIIKCLRQNQ